MVNGEKKKILAVMDDLFFTVKILDAAKRANFHIDFVKSDADVMEKAKEKPQLIIFDLSCAAVNAVKLITKIKSKAEFKGISTLGFLPHVQAELKLKAQEAGCDMVIARSAFAQNLPQILKRHAENYS